MRIVMVSALAAAALVSMGAAQAASSASASASLSNLQIQLVDLNPGDGIAPSISFTFGQGSNQGSASAGWNTSTGSQSASGTFFSDANPWRPGATGALTSFSSSSSSLAGNGTPGGSTLSAGGQAASPGNNLYDPNYFNYSTPSAQFAAAAQAPFSYYSQTFSLSPFTVAIFSANVSVQAAAIEGGITVYPWGYSSGFGNYASAGASLLVNGPAAGGGNGYQNASDGRATSVSSYYDSWSGTWWNASDAQSGFVGVSFTNLTTLPMGGLFRAEVSAGGTAYGNTAPIPEPGTWALLLAGLAVVGRLAARRR